MTFTKRLAAFVLLLALGLLMGCPGNMTVLSIESDDDDSVTNDDDDDLTPGDDDDLTPGDDDDLTPSDDDDTGPSDDDDDDDTGPGDDDDTGPAPAPIAECGPFVVPEVSDGKNPVHYTGEVTAHRPNQGDNRVWSGCEVRRYFNDQRQYQCQIYWSLNGERVEWDDPCSIYVVNATYVPEYSDCSPSELGNDDWYLNDFQWSYGTEYHWSQTELSLWTAAGSEDDVPGGPPGGQCGFNGPQGDDWLRWDEDIPFQNWGGMDGWEYLEFEYATDF